MTQAAREGPRDSQTGQRAVATGRPPAQGQAMGRGSCRQRREVAPCSGRSSVETGSFVVACDSPPLAIARSATICRRQVSQRHAHPQTPRPCPQPPGPLQPTLEHISCRALAMPLAGTLQWKTWHLRTQVSLSLATKAKSLQGHKQASETPAGAAPHSPRRAPVPHPLTCPCSHGSSHEGGKGTGYCWGPFLSLQAEPLPSPVPAPSTCHCCSQPPRRGC